MSTPLALATAQYPSCLHLPEQAGVNETLTFLTTAGGVRTSLSSWMVGWPRPKSRAGLPGESAVAPQPWGNSFAKSQPLPQGRACCVWDSHLKLPPLLPP